MGEHMESCQKMLFCTAAIQFQKKKKEQAELKYKNKSYFTVQY